MKRRLTELTWLLAGILILMPGARGADAAAKPKKQILRAADGLNLVCEVRGQGDTSLVFLHGWGGDREYWKHQVDEFSAQYRVVTLDQAGYGESGKNRGTWGVSGLAQDVESVVQALGLKRVILIGHSMGGPIALAAAGRMPGKVIAVVGVDTLQNAESRYPEETTKQLLDGFETDWKGTMRATYTALLPEQADPELKNWLVAKAETQNQKMAIALMRDLFAQDTTDLLRKAHTPVRCINSSGGFQFFTPTAVEINRKYGDYDVVILQGTGHYPMLEKPVEFNQKLRDVLKEFAPKKS